MSYIQTTILRCDAEGCEEEFKTGAGAIGVARLRAEDRGWDTGQHEDLCPEHAEEENA